MTATDGEKIDVRVTRSMRFRVTIQEPLRTMPYEVTVGGKAWQNGKGCKYAGPIFRAIASTLTKLCQEYKTAEIIST